MLGNCKVVSLNFSNGFAPIVVVYSIQKIGTKKRFLARPGYKTYFVIYYMTASKA